MDMRGLVNDRADPAANSTHRATLPPQAFWASRSTLSPTERERRELHAWNSKLLKARLEFRAQTKLVSRPALRLLDTLTIRRQTIGTQCSRSQLG